MRAPLVRINGRRATEVDATDRGLAYGDGLFETIAVADARPCLWTLHLQRLAQGCARLGIPLPEPAALLDECTAEINGQPQGALKIILTRGAGPRGYRAPDQPKPTRIVQFSRGAIASPAAAPAVQLRVCRTRLGWNPALAGIKHLNRLEQVMARREWSDPAIFEGLMLDQADHCIEGVMSNLFLWSSGALLTPDLARCGVAGVARRRVLEVAAALGLATVERDIRRQEVFAADGLLLTNSLIGYRQADRIEGRRLPTGRIPEALLTGIEAALFAA